MKTSIELDEVKLDLARKLGKTHSIKETIHKALDALITQSRREAMLELLGSNCLDHNKMQAAQLRPKK